MNVGRCLLPIGSLLSNGQLSRIREAVDVWGCGWGGERVDAQWLTNVNFHAVRGPRTVREFGLAPDIPLGDPALLLPKLCPHPIFAHKRTLVIPHFLRTFEISSLARCQQSGCDELLSTQVVRSWLAPQGILPPEALSLLRAKFQLGIEIPTPWQAIDRIAGASFVLTGSLHGAILAQAYGVPWAAYNDGYVNLPEKWVDWGEYLGVPIEFATTLEQGQQWWERSGQHGRVRPLYPLMAAFPLPVADEILARFA